MNFALSRNLIIFGVALPLAVVIGFTLATPQEIKTYLLMGVVTSTLLLPIMLKWYHPLLIFAWNAAVNVYFLPGTPELWMLVSVVGLGIAVLNNALDRDKRFLHVPAVTIPLLFFVAVVLTTAKLTGGIGLRSMGGQTFGGKGYFSILFAVMGYFALTSQTVPIERAKLYVAIFFLSGLTGVFSNLAYTLGPAFYFLFFLFPVELAVNQAIADMAMGQTVMRISGLAVAGSAAYYFLLSRFGVRGLFDMNKPWRMVFFLLALFVSMMAGFRSLLLTFLLVFAVQFWLEGLLRTRLCLVLLVLGIMGGALMMPYVDKMPQAVQRCLAFVPGLKVSPMAKIDAEGSTAWRVEMWRVVAPQIPQYLLLGKGYAINPTDLYLANQAQMRGLAKTYEVAVVSGAYHSGPLSLLIPFGIFGTIGFLWLMAAGIWVMVRNFRYGDPALKVINTFLLAYFVTRVILFFTIFGAADSDLFRFTGLLGLSVSLNRGVRKPSVAPAAEPVPLALQPA